MKKQGKSKDTAVLRTLINAKAQNFATKRLLKDLELIDRETIPTVGVTARPLEHDLFVWHANIRGPEGTPYEGGVFHLELNIPQSYPHQPPTVTLFTTIPHPNVFGNSVCLDMLQQRKKETKASNSIGWSSSYTIQSVLLQLQAFLFEEKIIKGKKEKYLEEIKAAVHNANEFKCTTKNCKHGGKLTVFPPFNKAETDILNFIQKKSPQELLEEHFICFHTKMHFKKALEEHEDANKLKKESCLGVLLNISKIPRTGQIKQAIPSLDYISIKAFLNEGIKWDTYNETYTSWLPLYFGKTDNKDRVMHLLKRSLSMIMTNNTRRFKPEFVLEVFPKIILTIVFQMMDQKTHASIRNLRLLTQVHALWLICMEEWPQLYEQVDTQIHNFLTSEKHRHKEYTPNLGIQFILLYVSQKYTFADIIETVLAEQFDRQVFWLLKEIPELDDEELSKSIPAKKRVEISFKQLSTGFQMGCFQNLYLSIAKKPFATNKELVDRYINNYCLLSTGQENAIQEQAFDIQKKVNSYDAFYEAIGVPKRSIEDIDSILKQAQKNSKARKYHGTAEEMNELPAINEQAKQHALRAPRLEEYFIVTRTVQDKNYSYVMKENKVSDDVWKGLVQKRWNWIADEVNYNHSNALRISQLSNQKKTAIGEPRPHDRLFNRIVDLRKRYDQEDVQVQESKFTWQQLFMKLDLEEFLFEFNTNPDFELLYAKLHIVKDHITDLVLTMIAVPNVSSAYHFITATIEKLTSLQSLTITGIPYQSSNNLPKKAARSVAKGLLNLAAVKNNLISILYNNIAFTGNQNEIVECVFAPLQKYLDTLRALKFTNCDLLSLNNASKQLGGLINNFKILDQIQFQNSIKNFSQAKEITDGLMRAKQLSHVNLSGNSLITEKGLSSIIYNLSFSPKLTELNISQCSGVTGTELVESLYKLLKINASIEVLNCQMIGGLNSKLTKEFFVSLGESRTLRVLNLNYCGDLDDSRITLLGKAVAFNANKGGRLSTLNIQGGIANYNRLSKLIDNMSISNYDHELWYGDEVRASKMVGEDHQKKFYSNLQNLDIGLTPLNSNFDLVAHNKQYKPKIEFLQFVQKNPHLQSLNFQSKSLNKRDADLLSQVLVPKTVADNVYIRYLNLAKNTLGKEGAKVISSILQNNKSIEFLDISQNQIGVSGGKSIALALVQNTTLKILNLFQNKIGFDAAKQFGVTLKTNTTLEFIDFGNNRIRNKGLKEIAEGIRDNKQSKINSLGLRFNFLTEEGIIHFLKNTNVKEIFIKNNSINEYGLFMLKKFYDEAQLQTRVDLFEKLIYTEESRLERTIWIQPTFQLEQLIQFFISNECGVIVDARTRKGVKHPNRLVAPNIFNFVEFADKNSLLRAMALAAQSKANIAGRAFRIYKAGTGTFLYQKKSAKQKKAETSKTNVIQAGVRPAAGRGACRGRGRGSRGGRGARR